MRVAIVAVSAERNETRRSERSSSSGSIAALASAADGDDHDQDERLLGAVGDRLERDVELPERSGVAQAHEHREARRGVTSALTSTISTAIGSDR